MSPAGRAFCPHHVPQGALGQSAQDGNELIVSKSETKARNGHTLTKENRMILRFSGSSIQPEPVHVRAVDTDLAENAGG